MYAERNNRYGPARLVILGGGVSGLAAARTAADASGAGEVEIIVLERSAALAGRAVNACDDGWLVEAGPSGYLDTDADFAALVSSVGLDERTVRANPAAARRYILQDGRVHRLHPLSMMRSGLLGPLSMLRALGEAAIPGRPAGDGSEESIRSFVARRFGASLADRIARTAMLGIFAGDAERLSVQACFPELAALEREAGSVIRGAYRRRRNRTAPRATRKLTSFRAGLREVPEALARHPRIDVRLGTAATRVAAENMATGGASRFRVETDDGSHVAADCVLVATSADAAADVVSSLAPVAAAGLREIPAPPVSVVALGYRQDGASSLPRGFGTLVARGEGYRMLGVLHEWQIYPERAPDGHALVRVMYGGRLDPEVAGFEDHDLVELAQAELSRAFGVSAPAVRSWVFRWRRAIPQYELGHIARRRRVNDSLATVPGLFLAGDALDGVSFVKTAATGMRTAREALGWLRAMGRLNASHAEPRTGAA